jgi:hypothetical protein
MITKNVLLTGIDIHETDRKQIKVLELRCQTIGRNGKVNHHRYSRIRINVKMFDAMFPMLNRKYKEHIQDEIELLEKRLRTLRQSAGGE